jgi:CRP-like cAMP-binding protein
VIATMIPDNESSFALGVLPAPCEEVLTRIGAHSEVATGDSVVGHDDGTTIAFMRAGLARVFVRTTPGRQATIGYAKPGDVISLPPRHGRGRYEVAAVRHTACVC